MGAPWIPYILQQKNLIIFVKIVKMKKKMKLASKHSDTDTLLEKWGI